RPGVAKDLEDLRVKEPIDQAISAKQEQVSRFARHGPHLRIHKLVARSQGSLQGVASGMLARLPFGDLGVAQEPTDVSVVMADLFDSSVQLRQVVEPAVSDVVKIHPARSKPSHAQGRSHAGAIRIAPTEIRQGFVDFAEEFLEDVVEIDCQAGRGAFEGGRQQSGDLVNGDPAGKFSGLRATHAIAYCKDKIDIL